MANEQNTEAPPFETMVAAPNFMSPSEMDRLIEEHAPLIAEAKLGAGVTEPSVRRSRVAFLGAEPRYRWLYERLWIAAQDCNRSFFGVDISTVEANVQLARYDSSDQGFYDGTPTSRIFGRYVSCRSRCSSRTPRTTTEAISSSTFAIGHKWPCATVVP